MADDSNNPKYLEVCRREVVFQHFPLKKLVDNPGVWTVLSYKIGRLIVKDSNDLEWIYIIKKGDARVIKQLRSQKVNLKERHRQIQARLDEADPYKQAQGMIHFVSAETSVQSAYKLGHYQPRLTNSAPPGGGHANQHSRRKPPPRITLSRSSSRLTDLVGGSSRPNTSMSCPPERTKSASVDPMIKRISSERNRVKGEQERTGVSNKTSPAMWAENKLGLLAHADIDSIAETSYAHRRSITLEKIKIRQDKRASLSIAETEEYEVEDRDQKDRQDHHDVCQMEEQNENEATTRIDEDDRDENENIVKIDNMSSDERAEGKYSSTASKAHKPKVRIADVVDSLSKKDSSYLQTGSRHGGGHARSRKTSTSSSVLSADKELLVDVPPFVQLETLTPGRIFGMRSCLDEEERGPSASLISGGCEVLQINKKFFLKNADEALIALIRLQHKPYPSEEDLLDRLDVNFQWDSFKKSTVNGFVRELKKRKGVVT